MSTPMVIEGTMPLRRHRRPDSPQADGTAASTTQGRCVPRIARLLALAWHVEMLVRSGTVSSYAVAAKLGHVSRARMSQILSLLGLAPDLQEQLLYVQRPARGRRALTLGAGGNSGGRRRQIRDDRSSALRCRPGPKNWSIAPGFPWR